MKMKEIIKVAMQKGIEAGKMNKTQVIRAIQKSEGYNDCFATSNFTSCGQMNCLWRKDCN